MARRLLRWLAIAALLIGYPLLAYFASLPANSATWGKWVVIGPVVLIAAIMAWRSPHRAIMLGLLALACAGLWAIWPQLEQNISLLYWLEHVGMQLALFAMFGRTLLAGRKPLCTVFADMVHGPLSPEYVVYSRQVTVVWTAFFAVIALISTALFFLAPIAVWSAFANFLTMPLVALMFIVEIKVRRRIFPGMRNSLKDTVRAFTNSSAPSR